MEIKTKFGVGDKVWIIKQDYKYERCPKCKGDSKELIGNIEYYCANCYGTGKVLSQELEWFVSENVGTITQIKTFIDEGGIDFDYFGGEIFASEYLGEEKNLFPTKAEAQAECDRRNNGNI